MLLCELLKTGKFELTEFDPVVTEKQGALHGKFPVEPVRTQQLIWETYEYLPDTV